jgi:DNA-binding transcriptional ArsR family regulator
MNDYLPRTQEFRLQGTAHPSSPRHRRAPHRGERCVCEIAAEFPFDRTTISKHLAVLRSAGVTRTASEGLKPSTIPFPLQPETDFSPVGTTHLRKRTALGRSDAERTGTGTHLRNSSPPSVHLARVGDMALTSSGT